MKKCFKCSEIKPYEAFYKKSTMKDGYRNSCILCTREYEKERQSKLISNDPNWIEKEKARHRNKYHRLNYREKHKPEPEQKKLDMENYKNKFPEKIRCKKLLGKKNIIYGLERHHWSYNDCDACDIIHLSASEHKRLHRFIIYDQERFMYRRIDTMELLDTKEKHIEFYNSFTDKI